MDEIVKPASVIGAIKLWEVNPENGTEILVAETKNQVMYTWGSILAHTLRGDNYKPNAMYIEYKNVAVSTDPVTVPTINRADNLNYYNTLPADQDFLRVYLSATPSISIYTGFESYFSAGDGNQLGFSATTAGTYGEQGRTFSDTVNSKVFGAALVTILDPLDRSKDVIFSRAYLTAGNQKLKGSGSGQVRIDWSIAFI